MLDLNSLPLLYFELYFGDSLLALAEIETLDVKHGRDQVYEEEADDCPVDVDDIIDVDLEEPDHEADGDHEHKIYNLSKVDLLALRLANLEHSKHPLPA